MNYDKILKEGIVIYSSGSSGEPKPYFQPPAKIKASNEVARKVQGIVSDSKIYTIMKINHAGGLFAQTLPGYEVGSTITIKPFNAYQFVKEIKNYTHSIISPLHAKIIMMTKSFENLDLSGITVSCGSEPVTWDIIESFVCRGAKFIAVWGMSEIGPFAITHTFDSMNEVCRIKKICPPNSTILGSNKHCQYKIENKELVVKGNICIFDDWYHTKDEVIEIDEILFYTGRTNMKIDFNNPKKGL
jgi:acyl-coenzyme A synthetase/AMP-(fatty) acid ligase